MYCVEESTVVFYNFVQNSIEISGNCILVLTVMVDNSTNINKKRATTSRFNSLNIKKTMTNDVGNPGPGLGQARASGGLNRLMGSR
jgi:hypothetical protein